MEATPAVSHSRVKERVLCVSTVCLYGGSFVFILYTLVFLVVYTQALYSVEKFQTHHESELKYFRFAWLSEQVCNRSRPASFVTISCNHTQLLNTTSRYDPVLASITESYDAMHASTHSLRLMGDSKESYIAKVMFIKAVYAWLVGPWVLLLLFPVAVCTSCALPWKTRQLLKEQVQIRKQKMKNTTRSMESIMQQEYRGSNDNVAHHTFVYQQQSSFYNDPISSDDAPLCDSSKMSFRYGGGRSGNYCTKEV